MQAVPGRPIPQEALTDADALMVRSVTKVNEALLSGKAIKFVGTATAGTDHVDQAWLQQAGIGFSAAPGCNNAIAVVEYVFSALLMLAERDGFALADRTVGIVGVGNVGGRLQKRLKRWELNITRDPPRADRGDEGDFRSPGRAGAAGGCPDFHTPLFKDGPYKNGRPMKR